MVVDKKDRRLIDLLQAASWLLLCGYAWKIGPISASDELFCSVEGCSKSLEGNGE